MRETLETLDGEFAFQTSGRFDLLAGEHVPYTALGASDVDADLARAIERAEGVITVVGRMGSGKSSLIASVADGLTEEFLPLRVSVVGVEVSDAAAFARHSITEIRDSPVAQLSRHEERALNRATAQRETRGRSSTRELRAGLRIAAGPVLTAEVVGDIKRGAKEELERAADPVDALGGLRRLFDVFWKLGRCPVLIVEDTDHWGGMPDVAEAFFDQTARAFAMMDATMVVATQSDYTSLDGYRRIRDKLTAEIALPCLPEVEHGLSAVVTRRMESVGVSQPIDSVLAPEALKLLAQSYAESVNDGNAGDLRRTLSVMRAALEVALDEPATEVVARGHVQEAMARTPLAPSSALEAAMHR
jgi:Cdc6-like AAA superfamily ATPase